MSIWHRMFIAVTVMAFATPVIAYRKNRPVFLWLALGVLLAPIPFFFILFLPALPPPPYGPPGALRTE